MIDIANTTQYATWNSIEGSYWAANHELYDRLFEDLNRPLFEGAHIQPGDHVLDIGCGGGQTTRIAALAAASGDVVGIDLSRPMLAVARCVAREEGIQNVTHVHGDAQVHDFPRASFDVAISRGGVMYFDDPPTAFSNIRTSLRPGGRLAFVCGRDEESPEFDAVLDAMSQHLALPSDCGDAEPGPIRFREEEFIRDVLEGSGFHDVLIRPRDNTLHCGPDAQSAAAFILGWCPIRFWIQEAAPEARLAACDEVASMLARRHQGDAVSFPMTSWLVTALADT